MAARFRPVWGWPLLALPPAAVALLWVESPAVHLGLLGVGIGALPLIRIWVCRRRRTERPTVAVDDALQLGWLSGGSARALDVAMTRLLGLGALQWAYDPVREVWAYHRVDSVPVPAELDLLHRLCAGGAQPWQLQQLAPAALGATRWTLVARGWWIDPWTSRWARLWSSLPLGLILAVSLLRLPTAAAAGLLPGMLALQGLAALLLLGNLGHAPVRTRHGRRAEAMARVPTAIEPLDALCWRVAREGHRALVGSDAEHWAEIREGGRDRRP